MLITPPLTAVNRHNITEILLKVALNIITPSLIAVELTKKKIWKK